MVGPTPRGSPFPFVRVSYLSPFSRVLPTLYHFHPSFHFLSLNTHSLSSQTLSLLSEHHHSHCRSTIAITCCRFCSKSPPTSNCPKTLSSLLLCKGKQTTAHTMFSGEISAFRLMVSFENPFFLPFSSFSIKFRCSM